MNEDFTLMDLYGSRKEGDGYYSLTLTWKVDGTYFTFHATFLYLREVVDALNEKERALPFAIERAKTMKIAYIEFQNDWEKV